MRNGVLKKVFILILGVYISSELGVKSYSESDEAEDDHDDL
jgi:hypothetical protein